MITLALRGHHVHGENEYWTCNDTLPSLASGRRREFAHQRRQGFSGVPDAAGDVAAPHRDPDVVLWEHQHRDEHREQWQKMRAEVKRGQRSSRLVFSLGDDVLNDDPVRVPTGLAWDVEEMRRGLRGNIRAMMAVSDLVIVTTPPLADVAREFNSSVAVLGNYLPEAWFAEPVHQHRPGPLTVGYTGASSHLHNFITARRSVIGFLQRHDDVHLYVREVIDPHVWNSLPPARRRYEKFIENAYGSFTAMNFDIGLVPLEDTYLNRSRTDLKYFEYSIRGIPTIASAVGAYAESIDHGRTGFLVHHPSEWAGYLEELRDPDRRRAMGLAARDSVRHRTMEANAWRWEHALCHPGSTE